MLGLVDTNNKLPRYVPPGSTSPPNGNYLEDKPDLVAPKITVISHQDQEYMLFLAEKLGNVPRFWEDRMRVNAAQSFANVFMNPNNFVVDIGPRAGVMAFVRDSTGYRAYLYGASWDRAAMRCGQQRRTAMVAAMASLDLLFIEAVTKADNILARRAMENIGMTYRGRYINGLCYNGVFCDSAIYELSRENSGLP
jgi:hypothetical protein